MSTKWHGKTTIQFIHNIYVRIVVSNGPTQMPWILSNKKKKKFIHEYKAHDCLWYFKSPSYKNKHMRESACRDIVTAMTMGGFGLVQ